MLHVNRNEDMQTKTNGEQMTEPKETGPDEIIFHNVVSILKDGGYPFVLLMGTNTRLERMQGFHAANGGEGSVRTSMIQQAPGQGELTIFKAEQLARQTEAWGAGREQTGLIKWVPKTPEPAKEIMPPEPPTKNSKAVEPSIKQDNILTPSPGPHSISPYYEEEPNYGPDAIDDANAEADAQEQELEAQESIGSDYDLTEYPEMYDNYDDYQG